MLLSGPASEARFVSRYRRHCAASSELTPSSQRVYDHYNTIDKLFAAIRRAIAFGGHKIAVEYDADLGFPSKADLDPRERTADDELFFKVTGFRKI